MAQFFKGGKNGHFAKAITKQMLNSGLFWVGTLRTQKHTKTTMESHYSNSMQSRLKGTLNVRQMTRFWKVTKTAILCKLIVRRRAQKWPLSRFWRRKKTGVAWGKPSAYILFPEVGGVKEDHNASLTAKNNHTPITHRRNRNRAITFDTVIWKCRKGKNLLREHSFFRRGGGPEESLWAWM